MANAIGVIALLKASAGRRDIISFVVALLMALAIGALIILVTGANPLVAYRAGLKAAAGTSYRFLNTLCSTTVLVMTGLACSIAFGSGIQNIGVEGQLYLGAFAAAIVGQIVGLPKAIHIPLVFLGAAIAGAIWAFIPGILRVWRGVNEVVVTLMMNYVAIMLTSYWVNYPFKRPGSSWPETVAIQESARMTYLFPLTRFNNTFFMSMMFMLLVLFVVRRTQAGYESKMVGLNPKASTIAGIEPGKTMLKAMLVSGALGGLAGGMEVTGTMYRFMDSFSPGFGMTGILIALVAQNDPIRVAIVAFIFAFMKNGASGIELATDVPAEICDILQTLIVLFLAAERSLRPMLNERLQRKAAARGVQQ